MTTETKQDVEPTPGDWKVNGYLGDAYPPDIIAVNGRGEFGQDIIVRTFDKVPKFNGTPDELWANARLLAAAKSTAAEHDRLLVALTPSAETKAAYIGEFSYRAEQIDEDGNSQSVTYFVPWTTIKEIMATIRARAVLKAHGPALEGGES